MVHHRPYAAQFLEGVLKEERLCRHTTKVSVMITSPSNLIFPDSGCTIPNSTKRSILDLVAKFYKFLKKIGRLNSLSILYDDRAIHPHMVDLNENPFMT